MHMHMCDGVSVYVGVCVHVYLILKQGLYDNLVLIWFV